MRNRTAASAGRRGAPRYAPATAMRRLLDARRRGPAAGRLPRRAAPPPRTPAAADGRPGARPTPPRPLRYVAMGDSYTIGYGLPRQVDRWPNQLVRALKPVVSLDLVENLAGQSAGTYEVIDEQLPVLEELDPGPRDAPGGRQRHRHLATHRRGVPRQPRDDPRRPGRAAGDRTRAPASWTSWAAGPRRAGDHARLHPRPGPAARPEPDGAAEKVDRFNDILAEVAAERGIAVVDIAPISDLVARDQTLLTDDGLHPSAKQYAGWVELHRAGRPRASWPGSP